MNPPQGHTKKEPLIHLTKRLSVSTRTSVLVRVGGVAAGFLLSALFVGIVVGCNPFRFFSLLVKGIIGTERRIWTTLFETSILLCIALALTPAFRMKFWNCGGQGQVLMGGLACAAVMFYLGPKLPLWLLFIVMTLASILAGAVWAVIPALFKAKWNTNETLFTLMMNYVAIQLVIFMTKIWAGNGTTTMKVMDAYGLPDIGNRYVLRLIVVALLTAGMYVYLNHFKHGYEISVVGESENTARYVGIDVRRVIIRTLLLSGAVCGVAGLLLVGGGSHAINDGIENGYGFTAIMVTWLGKFNPLTMILTSFLIVFLDKGGSNVASMLGASDTVPQIITGIMLLCIIGCEFFLRYQIHLRPLAGKEAKK